MAIVGLLGALALAPLVSPRVDGAEEHCAALLARMDALSSQATPRTADLSGDSRVSRCADRLTRAAVACAERADEVDQLERCLLR